jgi:hypothetical protein
MIIGRCGDNRRGPGIMSHDVVRSIELQVDDEGEEVVVDAR